jgi:hypothetical protein
MDKGSKNDDKESRFRMGIMDSVNAFGKVQSLGQRRPYDKYGRYYLLIEAVRLSNSFQQGGEYVAIEKTVVRCIEPHPDFPAEVNRPGEQVVDLIFSTGAQGKVFWQKLKSFLCGVLNEPDAEKVGPDDLKMALADEQPLKNMLIEMNNLPRSVKDKDNPGENKDVVAKSYVRGFAPAEAKAVLTAEEVERFYPDGLLERMIVATQAAV